MLTAHAWDVESTCEFCGSFIADDYICDCGEGGDHCSAESGRDCYEENHCGNCLSGVGEANICGNCGAGCKNCAEICEGCGISCENCCERFCRLCGLCFPCVEDYGWCYSCDVCGNCTTVCFCEGGCAECTNVCPSCAESCGICGDEFCEECGRCKHCADGNGWCSNCSICGDCKVTCFEGDGCTECTNVCPDCTEHCGNCWDEFCPECGVCSACTGSACQSCGMCENCADLICYCGQTCTSCGDVCLACGEQCEKCSEEMCGYCDRCKNCAGGYGWCSDCNNCGDCVTVCICDEGCSDCTKVCPECGEHCGKCWDDICPNCGICSDCADGYCTSCGMCSECTLICKECGDACLDCASEWCGNCATLCTDCAALCRDCAQTCATCGICEQCEAFCDSCELCVVCCEDVSSSYGCSHGICVESDEWKTHYCTVGGHCTTTLGEQDYDDDEHWYWCGDGCTAKVNVEPHVFSSAEITTQPTKTDEGVLTYYCDCGYSKTETIPVITEEGHTHHCVPAVVAATCTSGGYTVYTCECGYSYRANETPALGHTYEYQKDAGGHWLKCSFCTDEKPAAAHKFGAWTVTKDATYTQPGTKQRTCLTCGYADEAEIPVIGHAGHFVISFEGTDIGDMLSVGASHKVPELPVLPPKEEGNLFDGWTDQKTGAPVKAGDVLTGDIVLTPVWKDCGDGSHTDSDHDLVCDDCGKKLPAPVSYLILEGANSTWRKGSLTGLSFRSSADVAKFDGVTVDGTAIDAGCYSAELGSTSITLRAEYLETLPAGSHTLVIKAIDGTADTSFTVLEAETAEPGGSNVVDADLFALDQPCTRAQITFLLWRAAGSPEPKAMSSFVDVPADAYYAKAVAWAVETGIVAGTSETTFGPDEICICAQALDAFHRVNPE